MKQNVLIALRFTRMLIHAYLDLPQYLNLNLSCLPQKYLYYKVSVAYVLYVLSAQSWLARLSDPQEGFFFDWFSSS